MIIEHAKAELAAVNFGEEDSLVMIVILKIFFSQWDSGGSVFVASNVLQRLLACQPLGPLTGEDSEWYDPGIGGYLQNRRCSTVFKDADGRAYDIDVPGRPTITFPYFPANAEP